LLPLHPAALRHFVGCWRLAGGKKLHRWRRYDGTIGAQDGQRRWRRLSACEPSVALRTGTVWRQRELGLPATAVWQGGTASSPSGGAELFVLAVCPGSS
jgi:hypothetical protein